MINTDEQYGQFLQNKIWHVPSVGRDIHKEDIHPLLFPFQRDLVQWAVKKGRAAIFAATGLGKTFMQIEWAKHVSENTLIVAPLSVAEQTIEEGKKIDVEIQFCAEPQSEPGLWITNYQKLHKFAGAKYDAIVLDECFAPDTKIDCQNYNGSSIRKEIKDVRPGDKIINVSGIDMVRDVHRREILYAIRITIDGEKIISSPNHPYFTQRGWVAAQDLEPEDCFIKIGSAMRLVRNDFFSQAGKFMEDSVLREILLSEMENESSDTQSQGPHKRNSFKNREKDFGLVTFGRSQSYSECRKNQIVESYEGVSSQKESLPPIERNTPQTFRAWGQWDWIDDSTTDFTGCSRKRLASGISFISGQATSWLSVALQDRYSQLRAQSRYRSGWSLASFEKREGFKKRQEAHFSWVESIEILESGHPDLEKYRDATGRIYFYDIGATQHPSFSVNGYLVHNSSIMKNVDGKTKKLLIEEFTHIPFRLCCTATPSPNDITELANHAEFLGLMKRVEMLASFFVHDSSGSANVGGWRLKGHAEEEFWRWIASWAMYVRKPSDIGHDDEKFLLPPLTVNIQLVETTFIPEGELFPRMIDGIKGRSQARKISLNDRVQKAAEIISQSKEQWLVWCWLNDEGRELYKLLSDAVLIEGAQSDEEKIKREQQWRHGNKQTLISKVAIFGFGMNWQHCRNILYLGISDSFEQWHQSTRRCWRFGQKNPVNVIVVTSKAEMAIIENVRHKEEENEKLADGIVHLNKEIQMEELSSIDTQIPYEPNMVMLPPQWNTTLTGREKVIAQDIHKNYTLYHGDSIELAKMIPSESVHCTITSPPFVNLFVYSASNRDVGNAKNYDKFFEHMDFLIPELLRMTLPGRRACIHLQQVLTTKVNHGVIGLIDFRGDMIRSFVKAGWIYDGEVAIDKNPQVAAIRTHSKGLSFGQKNKDSSWSRPALADYIILFRKDGENVEPILNDISNEEWIKLAHPVWYDIKETYTLNAAIAREEKDERHICPLQLETIERCLRLWSNKGDIIFDPFAGIGSTGYMALKLDRRFLGIELKQSYYKTAIRNLREAENRESTLL